MTLTKDAIVEKLKSRTEYSSQEARNIIEMLLEIVKIKLEAGEEVKVSGFGKWTTRQKKSRPGRNPHSGQKIEITARRVVTFHPSEKMREIINNADLDDSKVVMAGDIDDDDD